MISDTAVSWLTVRQGRAPLVLSLPHTGADMPPEIEGQVISPWLARKDCDWRLETLYAFADAMDATVVRTALSRTVVDVNRDPSGVSLYPGQATTGLCPIETFDGEPLYPSGSAPNSAEVDRRRNVYFAPYHAALSGEIGRLRRLHDKIVLYDAHSIRSRIPRLFEGLLPNFNLGTNSGASCDPALASAIEAVCDRSSFSRVTDARFKGGWITRHYGDPGGGVHAVQMELACRGYMADPDGALDASNWPGPFDPDFARPLQAVLKDVLQACLVFAGVSR